MPQDYNQFSEDILFSSLVSFAFFYSCFLLLFVCCFLKLQMYILIHIGLSVRVSDKENFYPADFRKQDFFFLA